MGNIITQNQEAQYYEAGQLYTPQYFDEAGIDELPQDYYENTSLAAPEALAHRLQRRTACNTSPPNLSKMADGAWKYVKPYVIEPSDQLLLNKFFDPSTPSMRT